MLSRCALWLAALSASTVVSGSLAAADELELVAVPRFDQVKAQTLDWLAQRPMRDDAVLTRVGEIWVTPTTPPSAAENFDRVIETFRLADPAAAEFIDRCQIGSTALTAPDAAMLSAEGMNEFFRTNLAQYLGRHLVQQLMYEEAIVAFEQVQLPSSVDPASYLFHLAVAQQQLLMKEDGLATLDKLLHHTEAVPPRYSTLGGLMEYQLQALKPESLDEVAARMKDIERRLALARGGPKTQKKEEEVLVLLDSIIQKLEQSSNSSPGEGDGGNTNQPGQGAKDSTVKGNTAPGETDSKDLKKQAGWGSLPDADQARAKQEMKNHYPEHYRRAVDAYFKKSGSAKPK